MRIKKAGQRASRPGSLASLWIGSLVLSTVLLVGSWGAIGCGGSAGDGSVEATVLADTGFLADIVANVAGERWTVESLLPEGSDPHSFEPTPRDGRRVAECRAMVINAVGLIPTVDELLAGVGRPDLLVIDASAGLPGGDDDPHFWLDPVDVMTYVDNIVAGLTSIDPEGADEYGAAGAAYKAELSTLDSWVSEQVRTIPADRRLLVTNHESLGRFAARYDLEVVGSIFPSVTGEGDPSARDVVALIQTIRSTGAPAIFLETGTSDQLARQIAAETGVTVVDDLYTHTLGPGASTYLEMIRWDVERIVRALL